MYTGPNALANAQGLDPQQAKTVGLGALLQAVIARIQTVHRETNPRFYELLSCFKQRTGCPVIVNTSFNVRGEPIVCTPEDAFRCFMGTAIEALAVGNCLLLKPDQDPSLARTNETDFGPD